MPIPGILLLGSVLPSHANKDHRLTERKRDRQTNRQRDRQTNRQRERQRLCGSVFWSRWVLGLGLEFRVEGEGLRVKRFGGLGTGSGVLGFSLGFR